MPFKDILIALTTYPEPTAVSAVEDAVSISVALGARISAIADQVKIPVPESVLSHALGDIPAMIGAALSSLHGCSEHSRKRPAREALQASELCGQASSAFCNQGRAGIGV
jgi:hypothetical protein